MNPIRFAVIAVSIMFSQSVFSQINVPDTITERNINLDEVVVSVNKTEEAKKTIAQQVQTLSLLDVAKYQAQSTADLIANSGNVFVQKSQLGGGSITIRGFEASRTLLVIDGVRMNNLIYRAGHLQNIVTTDNNSLERVEILFGPSSTVYGSDALGGVVHLYTRNPSISTGNQNNIKLNYFSRYGSVNNEFSNHFDFNFGTKKFASLTSFTYSKFGDLRGGTNKNPYYKQSYGERPDYVERTDGKDMLVHNSDPYRQVQSGYSQYDLLQKFLYRQNKHLSHGINIQYSNSTDVPRYDRLTDRTSKGLKYAEWYYGPQARFLAAYDLNLKNPESSFRSIHFGLNYQNVEESRHTRKFGSNDLGHRIERVNVFGANLDFQKLINNHNIRFGLDGQYNTLKSTANNENISTGISVPLDTRYPDGDNNMLNVALYFSHTWKITEQIILVDGIRAGYSSLHSTFIDRSFFNFPFTEANQKTPVYSGNIGIIHNPSDAWKLSLLISTGYRVPNVDDLSKVFESASGIVIVPNADLKPERTVNTELGVTKIFNKKTRWENVFYYTHFDHAIVSDKFTFTGQSTILYDGSVSQVYANQNKKEAFLYGFSSNLKSQLSRDFLFTFNLSYTYGRIKNGGANLPLDHIPPLLSRASLTYAHKKFSSDFFVNYNGWKRLKNYYLNGEDNEQYATDRGMPAWFTLNLRGSYELNQYFSVQVGMDNMLDTQYRTFSSGVNAPGRNIFACVRFRL